MGLEKVKDDVLDRAKSEAEKIVGKAEEESRLVINQAEQKAKEITAEAEKEASTLLESMKSRELLSAQLEAKKLELEAKKEMVNEVFSEAKNKIEKLNENKRKELTKKLLEKAKKEVEIKTIYCSKKDAKFIEGFEVKEANIFGGIIAETGDESMRVDYSFDSLLQNINENYLQDIAKILFG